ncbi:hypothetical protein [Aliikangiella sp. G2MR2-5]|uniref:hypothetical protein n=1 Tax=Aliikangiella sp. G2MR2-5 TaxID=2788943 RepID=UPI0018AC14A3|nr:hypothetical protein [Aliikangiella sp. G2MR2-5]
MIWGDVIKSKSKKVIFDVYNLILGIIFIPSFFLVSIITLFADIQFAIKISFALTMFSLGLYGFLNCIFLLEVRKSYPKLYEKHGSPQLVFISSSGAKTMFGPGLIAKEIVNAPKSYHKSLVSKARMRRISAIFLYTSAASLIALAFYY